MANLRTFAHSGGMNSPVAATHGDGHRNAATEIPHCGNAAMPQCRISLISEPEAVAGGDEREREEEDQGIEPTTKCRQGGRHLPCVCLPVQAHDG